MLKNDSQSIQQLLASEKKADEILNQARQRKIKRLKEAKEDARKEIEVFRTEKEKDFKEKEAKYAGSREGIVQKIELDTEKAVSDMAKNVKLNQNTIISYLTEKVFTINCELHANFRSGVY